MPGHDLLHTGIAKRVEVEPILPTIAWNIAGDLWPDVDSVEISKTSDLTSVHARLDGRAAYVNLYFGDGNLVVADVGVAISDEIETVNAPDRSVASIVLARLRGER
jgi:hypothetical protein